MDKPLYKEGIALAIQSSIGPDPNPTITIMIESKIRGTSSRTGFIFDL